MRLDCWSWAGSSTAWVRAWVTPWRWCFGAWLQWDTQWQVPSPALSLRVQHWDWERQVFFLQALSVLRNGFRKKRDRWQSEFLMPDRISARSSLHLWCLGSRFAGVGAGHF